MINKWLRRDTHRSTRSLETAIRAWIDIGTRTPTHSSGHKSADEILDTLAAYCERISDSGH
jgi:hypothetical protein